MSTIEGATSIDSRKGNPFSPRFTSHLVHSSLHLPTSSINPTTLTWGTFALVGNGRRLTTCPSILARRRRTGNVLGLAILSRVSRFTVALVRSMRVDALATVATRTLQTLLNILLTGLAFEAARTLALELARIAHRLAIASVLAGRRRTDVLFLAVPARVSGPASAFVLVQRAQHTIAVVPTR